VKRDPGGGGGAVKTGLVERTQSVVLVGVLAASVLPLGPAVGGAAGDDRRSSAGSSEHPIALESIALLADRNDARAKQLFTTRFYGVVRRERGITAGDRSREHHKSLLIEDAACVRSAALAEGVILLVCVRASGRLEDGEPKRAEEHALTPEN
jgi:hypothetical protein